MMIRETTDRQSPLALGTIQRRRSSSDAGLRRGARLLGVLRGPEREAMLELLARSSLPEDRLARNRTEVERA